MQPYTGAEPPTTAEIVPATTNPLARLQHRDLFNLIAIVAGWGVLLLLIRPEHDYPIVDDWIYAGSVRDLLQTGTFTLPTHSQASLIGLDLLGRCMVEAVSALASPR